MNRANIPFSFSFFPLFPLFFLLWLVGSGCQEDPCETVSCENGGTCIDGTCECIPGFVGDQCQFFDPRQYFGSYRADYTDCFVTNDNHRVLIEEVPNQAGLLAIVQLGDYACPSGDFRVEAEVAGDSLTIPEQLIDCGAISYTISGSGTLTGGTVLNLNFTVSYDAGGFVQVDECSARLEK